MGIVSVCPRLPGTVLIGLDDRLLASDDTIPGPLLRVYKVEILRQHLLQSRMVHVVETPFTRGTVPHNSDVVVESCSTTIRVSVQVLAVSPWCSIISKNSVVTFDSFKSADNAARVLDDDDGTASPDS